MKVVVVGGNGLIGKKLCTLLRQRGHEALAASPSSGVNSVTGEGLDAALAGAGVVVDVTNSPSFAQPAVQQFFESSTRNLLAAEKKAGVGHHVAVSIVGTDLLPDSGYLVAKLAQETLIRAGGVPYTILRATQFQEFAAAIVGAAAVGNEVRMPSALMQPIAADDVAAAVLDVALAPPVNGIVEVAGPEPIAMDELARRYLATQPGDPRKVVTDESAQYFGTKLAERSLVPQGPARLGPTRFEHWLVGVAPAK